METIVYYIIQYKSVKDIKHITMMIPNTIVVIENVKTDPYTKWLIYVNERSGTVVGRTKYDT